MIMIMIIIKIIPKTITKRTFSYSVDQLYVDNNKRYLKN